MPSVQRFALILFLGSLQSAFAEADSRSGQWVYRGSGDSPSATFMDWSHSKTIFSVSCTHRSLVVRYFGDEAIKARRGDTISLILDGYESKLKTTLADGKLEGRTDISPDFISRVLRARSIDIDAPNEMGEPWYTGTAPALKQLIKTCR